MKSSIENRGVSRGSRGDPGGSVFAVLIAPCIFSLFTASVAVVGAGGSVCLCCPGVVFR